MKILVCEHLPNVAVPMPLDLILGDDFSLPYHVDI